MPGACTRCMCLDKRPFLRLSYFATSGCCHLPSRFQMALRLPGHERLFTTRCSLCSRRTAKADSTWCPGPTSLRLPCCSVWKQPSTAEDARNLAYSALCHWEPRPVWHSWTSEDHMSEKPFSFPPRPRSVTRDGILANRSRILPMQNLRRRIAPCPKAPNLSPAPNSAYQSA
ncbi:hypothetical protein PMIN01_07531 [Paraphaeosphaeria minitans]|uniref:Uncharacterized protein n=1 Tax=Paraphaeosphaeria minitans TaxID=565426 RepID=A0A9P6GG18_9PLEO|nr:hypothetical protein PMIN01_07531 [Paraphaeosphaeria minitans]